MERTHSVLLESVRSCLLDSKLPEIYWNYSLKHVTNCRNIVANKKTTKIPYEIVFGKPSPDLSHIKPFGCRVEFRPPVKKLKTFEPRSENGINLCHESGGIYRIETRTGIGHTKHVKFFKSEFPGKFSSNAESD